MRVAVDVTPLVGTRTGIGRSVEEMLTAVRAAPGAPAVTPFVLGAQRLDGAVHVRLPTRALVAAWSRADLPRVDRWLPGAQVLHATNFVVPPSRLPTLATVHDLSFLLHPGTVSAVTAQFTALLRRALARGAHVHTATEAVADEVEEHLAPGLRAQGRVHVVPFGVPALAPAGELPAGLAGRPYLLALGRVEPRKDLPTLVRAFSRVAADLPEHLLVLAGPPGPAESDVAAAVAALPAPVRARVRRLGPVDEPTRSALLEGAAALGYPSVYEGFGFPVLEALTLGTPVVASDLAVLREVGGDTVGYARVGDEEAFAAALLAAVRGPRAPTGPAGRAAGFSWARTGEGLVSVYRSLA